MTTVLRPHAAQPDPTQPTTALQVPRSRRHGRFSVHRVPRPRAESTEHSSPRAALPRPRVRRVPRTQAEGRKGHCCKLPAPLCRGPATGRHRSPRSRHLGGDGCARHFPGRLQHRQGRRGPRLLMLGSSVPSESPLITHVFWSSHCAAPSAQEGGDRGSQWSGNYDVDQRSDSWCGSDPAGMLMSAQIRDSVDTLTTRLGRWWQLVPTLHQRVNVFKPLLTVRGTPDPWAPPHAAPGRGPQQVGGGSEPGPPSCPANTSACERGREPGPGPPSPPRKRGKDRAQREPCRSVPGGGQPGAQAGGWDERLGQDAGEQIGDCSSGSGSAVWGLRE